MAITAGQPSVHHSWITTAHHSWTDITHHSWTRRCPSQLDIHCPSQLHSHTSVPHCPSPAIPQIPKHFWGWCPCAQRRYRCSGCPSLADPSPGRGEIRTGGRLGSGSLSHHAALSPGAAGSSLNAAFKRQQGLHCDAFIFTKRKLFSPLGWRGAEPVGCQGRRGQGTRVYPGQSRPTRAGAAQGTQHPAAAPVEIPTLPLCSQAISSPDLCRVVPCSQAKPHCISWTPLGSASPHSPPSTARGSAGQGLTGDSAQGTLECGEVAAGMSRTEMWTEM